MKTCPLCESSCDDTARECPTCGKVFDGSLTANAAVHDEPADPAPFDGRALEADALHPPERPPRLQEVTDRTPPGSVRRAARNPREGWQLAQELLSYLPALKQPNLGERGRVVRPGEEMQAFFELLEELRDLPDEEDNSTRADPAHQTFEPPSTEWDYAAGMVLVVRGRLVRTNVEYETGTFEEEKMFYTGVYGYFDHADTLHLCRLQGSGIKPGQLLRVVYEVKAPEKHFTVAPPVRPTTSCR